MSLNGKFIKIPILKHPLISGNIASSINKYGSHFHAFINKEHQNSTKTSVFTEYMKNIKRNTGYTDTTSFSRTDKIPYINISEFKKNNKNDSNYVKLSSLFSLPSLEKKINKKMIHKVFSFDTSNDSKSPTETTQRKPKKKLFNNISIIKIINKYSQKNNSMDMKNIKKDLDDDSKDKKFKNLKNFMKNKYYEDVDKKFEKKLKSNDFVDFRVKDKIIEIGRVGVFWKGVFDFCYPMIFSERYKTLQKKFANTNLSKLNFNKSVKYKLINQKIYTSEFNCEKIHLKNRNSSIK